MQVFVKVMPDNKLVVIDVEASDLITVISKRVFDQLNINPVLICTLMAPLICTLMEPLHTIKYYPRTTDIFSHFFACFKSYFYHILTMIILLFSYQFLHRSSVTLAFQNNLVGTVTQSIYGRCC